MNCNLLSLVIGCACLASFAHAQAPQKTEASSPFEKREHREGDKQLAYRLMVPRAYDATKAWPLIIWLHGSGEIGNNNTAQLSGITSTFLGNSEKCPALVMVPQCPEGSSWLAVGLNAPPKIAEPSRMIIATIVELQKEFNLDDRRIYIGGFSMGGCGTWDLLSRYPHLFAAAFPIGGPPGDRKGLAPLIKEVPIWVFHGDKDRVAPVESSRTIVAALRAVDAPVKYTEYRGGGHEMSQALSDPSLQEWIFSQRRDAAADFTASQVPEDASLITKTLAHGTHSTWAGKVERTGHGVPRLVIDGTRYRLKPAPDAAADVKDILASIGKGTLTGEYAVTGTVQLDDRAWLVVEKIVAVTADAASKP